MNKMFFQGAHAQVAEESFHVGREYGFDGSTTGRALILDKQTTHSDTGQPLRVVIWWCP